MSSARTLRVVRASFAADPGLISLLGFAIATLTAQPAHVGARPWDVLAIWDGGNAIYGALIGGAIGI
ncbi:hypothetical protein [Microbacterium sp. Gd 4-13]|uniref:hypothetical protein n=1 Tax=Microbacterium sp. Gd 4-13 TaxID=2173179 RepID=UPI0010576920|nr:hypothetical protein [Microbacterium sp. Gd 4-13]